MINDKWFQNTKKCCGIYSPYLNRFFSFCNLLALFKINPYNTSTHRTYVNILTNYYWYKNPVVAANTHSNDFSWIIAFPIIFRKMLSLLSFLEGFPFIFFHIRSWSLPLSISFIGSASGLVTQGFLLIWLISSVADKVTELLYIFLIVLILCL